MTPARIRAIRDKLGLTNAQLAATCGVSVQTVYGWLKPATCRKHGPPNVSARVLLELLERRAGNGTKKLTLEQRRAALTAFFEFPDGVFSVMFYLGPG